MVEFDNSYARLTPEEQDATGLPSPILVDKIDCPDLLSRLDEAENFLLSQQGADDDELTHVERASLVPFTERLQRDKFIIQNLAAAVTAKQAELFLEAKQ